MYGAPTMQKNLSNQIDIRTTAMINQQRVGISMGTLSQSCQALRQVRLITPDRRGYHLRVQLWKEIWIPWTNVRYMTVQRSAGEKFHSLLKRWSVRMKVWMLVG
jgi:hypothetical protein